jgi:hypothetical protein
MVTWPTAPAAAASGDAARAVALAKFHKPTMHHDSHFAPNNLKSNICPKASSARPAACGHIPHSNQITGGAVWAGVDENGAVSPALCLFAPPKISINYSVIRPSGRGSMKLGMLRNSPAKQISAGSLATSRLDPTAPYDPAFLFRNDVVVNRETTTALFAMLSHDPLSYRAAILEN